MKPSARGEPVYLESPNGGHCFWGADWKITEKGEFININYEKIKAQSGIFKLVMKKLGKQLFSGKSIMNMSLPIQVFGDDTILQRLSRGYCYAPILM